jgi:hypothetical protein
MLAAIEAVKWLLPNLGSPLLGLALYIAAGGVVFGTVTLLLDRKLISDLRATRRGG